MAHIDYYFSTLSPSAYLAGLRLEEMAERRGAGLTYKPMDLMALFARTGGVPLGQRHPSRQAYRAQDLARQAKALGMPITMKPAHFPTNPAPSSYAIIAAQLAGGGDLGALVHSVLRALWVEEKDIAEDAVVRACMSGAGFDPGLVDSGLLTGAEIYAANLEQAVTVGVFGAPYYVVDNGQMFWGQDRLDDLEAHLAGTL